MTGHTCPRRGFFHRGIPLSNLILAFALALVAVLAAPRTARSEPWIFIVRGTTSDDADYFEKMMKMKNWDADAASSGIFSFYNWIAKHQHAFGDVQGCAGAPLKKATMLKSEQYFRDALAWYLSKGFGNRELGNRPRGARVKPGLFGPRVLPGKANYLSCDHAGFMQTINLPPGSANRITIGPGTNALLKHEPTFRLSAAHELGHVFQNNVAPFARSPFYHDELTMGDWIIEGAADASAVLAVQQHYGKDYFGPYSNKYLRRFFLARAYNIPLNLAPGAQKRIHLNWYSDRQKALLRSIDSKTLDLLDYQTNGFWYHVIERYLHGNPRGLRKLYKHMTGSKVAGNVTRVVDRFLDSVDGKHMKGLEHVYPQFLSEYAAWWHHRFNGHMTRRKWLDMGFNGCPEADKLGLSRTSTTIPLRLAEYSGVCFRVRVAANAAGLAPEIEIRMTDKKNVVDEVYLGRASAHGFAEKVRNLDCYEIVEKKISPLPAPCLLYPMQGISNGRLQRYFLVPTVHGDGKDVTMTFIATWVPYEISDVGDSFDQEIVNATVSLDYGALSMDNDRATPVRSGGAGRKAGGKGRSTRKRAAITEYASKEGRARVAPEGTKNPSQAGPRDIFSGNVDVMGGLPASVGDALKNIRDASITVRLEPKDGQADNEVTTVGFRFLDTPQPGKSGPVSVTTMVSRGDMMGIQNPGKKSSLIIEAYDDDTLRFHGTANVCEGTQSDLLGARGGDLCTIFKPRSYSVRGAVSFPTARNNVARLQSKPTPAYRAYRDLRLDTLLGFDGSGGLLKEKGLPIPGTNAAEGGGRSRRAGSGSRTRCDCSCAAKRSTHSLQCALLCGKEWKQCPM